MSEDTPVAVTLPAFAEIRTEAGASVPPATCVQRAFRASCAPCPLAESAQGARRVLVGRLIPVALALAILSWWLVRFVSN